jgi:hypothetical protein
LAGVCRHAPDVAGTTMTRSVMMAALLGALIAAAAFGG